MGGYIDAHRVARGVGVGSVAVIGGAVVVGARGRLIVTELVVTVRAGRCGRDVVPGGVVGGVLEGDGRVCDWGAGAQRAGDSEVLVDGNHRR